MLISSTDGHIVITTSQYDHDRYWDAIAEYLDRHPERAQRTIIDPVFGDTVTQYGRTLLLTSTADMVRRETYPSPAAASRVFAEYQALADVKAASDMLREMLPCQDDQLLAVMVWEDTQSTRLEYAKSCAENNLAPLSYDTWSCLGAPMFPIGTEFDMAGA